MTIQEITFHKEDQTFDCKSIQIDPKALAIPIVAFANADGGVISISVSDKTRKIKGVIQYTEKAEYVIGVPLDFCNFSVSINSNLSLCIDNILISYH
ncbi:ATP-binding protein [Prevotella melaninogenica]|nr:ATP-binding protein [Prevotella melaninogenica]